MALSKVLVQTSGHYKGSNGSGKSRMNTTLFHTVKSGNALHVAKRWSVVSLLVTLLGGCEGPSMANLPFAAPTPTPTVPQMTRTEFAEQLCTAIREYEMRHRRWHATPGNPQDGHWAASFVPMVHDPLLKHFENPPSADHAEAVAIRVSFETASEKFAESARLWANGDKDGALKAENESFKFIFGEFPERAKTYFGKQGVSCTGF